MIADDFLYSGFNSIDQEVNNSLERHETEFCEIRALETVDHEEHIPVEPPKRDVFREQIAADADIQEFIRVIKQGWPAKRQCPLLSDRIMMSEAS